MEVTLETQVMTGTAARCGEGFCGHGVSFRWSQIEAEVTSESNDVTFDGIWLRA